MRRRYKKGTGIGVIAFVILMLFGIVFYKKVGLEEESAKAEIKIKRLKAQIEEQEERELSINNLRAYVQTKRYIEDIAREKLGLVYPDDIIIREEDEED